MRTTFDKERFNKDYMTGLEGENRYKEYIHKYTDYYLFTISESEQPFKDFDFIIYNETTQKLITVEIKTDTANTHNIAVQIYSSSKTNTKLKLPNFAYTLNSGVFATKADEFVTYNICSNSLYIANTKDLQNHIFRNPALRKTIANKNKSEFTGLVLLPKKDWIDIGRVIALN